MKSIFRYPGGKSKVCHKIKKYFPTDFEEYREPMVGGGGVYFSIDQKMKRWINDLDEDLISVYRALAHNPTSFINSCREIKPNSKEEQCPPPIYNERLKKIFNNLINDPTTDKALKYFMVNRCGWGGRVNYDIKSRLYFSNPNGWNVTKKNKLEMAAEILKNTKITCTNYQDLLSSPGINVFIYIDPPYYKNTKLSKTSQLYRYNFTEADHIMMASAVKKCQHKILLSYDDDNDGFIRSLYENQDGINIYKENWTYSGTSSAKGQSSSKKTGKELLITNYKI